MINALAEVLLGITMHHAFWVAQDKTRNTKYIVLKLITIHSLI